MDKITFVLPSRNNLEFLKLAYDSIRELNMRHEILILDDASTDGTNEWIEEVNDPDLITYRNAGPDRIGIVGMFDKGIEMSRTDIIMAFHADMIAAPDLDKYILEHLEPGTIVSATRVEPPLHPEGAEKITLNFGIEADEFKKEEWLQWCAEPKYNAGHVTEGIFAPWCMYKSDYLAVGGHDELFAPQSKEDSDLFNRFVLNGYKVKQSWDALVYHFTSRGSRFNKHAGGGAGQNSNEWLYTTNKNGREFIRKWGHFIKHDEFMKPIIPPKYRTLFRVDNCTNELLHALEPWCDKIAVDMNFAEYITSEQVNTAYDLASRVTLHNYPNKLGGVEVKINGRKFTQQDFQIIQQLSEILADSGDIGQFAIGNLSIIVHDLKSYEKDLIVCE